MKEGEILLSEITWRKIENYYNFLRQNDIDNTAGWYFKKQLTNSNIDLHDMDLPTFTRLLIQSKKPQVFAESHVYHDKRDWTLAEEDILGDISVHIPVQFFNNGGHYNTFINHDEPIAGHLIYVAGALLASPTEISADLNEVMKEKGIKKGIDQNKFNALYERRLLPGLFQINNQAALEHKKAAVTIPGIGTGLFSGHYSNVIKKSFRRALKSVLNKYASQLKNIDVVHYDPYEGDLTKEDTIQHIQFRVCPSKENNSTGQLAFPKDTSAETHTLTSLVAWDHFSWPGNDFWQRSRRTDDGVKAASTNTMEVITGISGNYDKQSGSYMPLKLNSWESIAKQNNIVFSGPIYRVDVNGVKTPLLPKDTQQSQFESNNGRGEEDSQTPTDHDHLINNSSHQKNCCMSSIVPSMQILGGFITVIGIAAAAASLTMLALGIGSISAIIALGVFSGVATLAGIGLFSAKYMATPKQDSYLNKNIEPETIHI